MIYSFFHLSYLISAPRHHDTASAKPDDFNVSAEHMTTERLPYNLTLVGQMDTYI